MKKKLRWLIWRMRENKVVRSVLIPPLRMFRRHRAARYAKSEDCAYLKGLHNGHLGQRCFVIGNGPSLLPEDLNKLAKNDIASFGTNRIYRIYPNTVWRPTYYVCIDKDTLLSSINDIKNAGDYPKMLNYSAAKYGRKESDNVHYICMDWHMQKDYYNITAPDRLVDDPSQYFSYLGTVTATAIELAMYMGFSEIYLLGCDHNYALKARKDGTIYRDPTVKTSYFAGGGGEKDIDSKLSVQHEELMTGSYIACENTARERSVRIYNATRGGKLEVFERVDFDSIVQ